MAVFETTSNSYTLRLTVTQQSQSIADNQTTLAWSLVCLKNSGTGLWSNNPCSWNFKVDNTTQDSGSTTYDFRNYDSLTLDSGSFTVTHESDGKKTINVSAYFDMDNEPLVYPMTVSGSMSLTTIPRTSTVSASNQTIASTGGADDHVTVTINKAAATFTHKRRWRLGDHTSGWSDVTHTNTLTETFDLQYSGLVTYMPTTAVDTLTIEVRTYSGADLVGTASKSITLTITMKPSVTLSNIQLNTPVPAGITAPVAGYTSLKCTWVRDLPAGAISGTTYFTINKCTPSVNSSTSGSGTLTTGTLVSSSSNYTVTLSAYAIDSRGLQGTTTTQTITVYGYKTPKASLTCYRTSTNSSTTEDAGGTYAYVKFSGSARMTDAGNSTQSVVCTYVSNIPGDTSGTVPSSPAWKSTPVDKYITFTLVVTDRLSSTTVKRTVNLASFPLDLYDENNGTVGVGLGTLAEADLIKMGLDTLFLYNKNLVLVTSGGTRITIPAEYMFGYQNNDTISITSSRVMLVGNVTNSGQTLNFFIPLDKSLYNISSCSVTNMEIAIRGIAGNVDGSGSGKEYEGASGYTVSTTVNKVNRGIYVSIVKTSAFDNATNNTCVAIAPTKINLTLNT